MRQNLLKTRHKRGVEQRGEAKSDILISTRELLGERQVDIQ